MIGRGFAGAGVALAAVVVTLLHVLGAGRVDPVAQTVSDYVAVPEGGALLGVAAAGLIAAGLASAVTFPGAARRLMLVWAAAVLLVAVFPTNLPDTPPDTAALVHRWAGALVFALPPIAGAVAARATGARRPSLWAASVAAGATAAAFLLAHAPHVLAGADVFGFLGVVERIAYVALLVQLLVAVAPVTSASPAGREPAPVAPADDPIDTTAREAA